MNDILKKVQEGLDFELENYMGRQSGYIICKVEDVHARDRALAIAFLEADVERYEEEIMTFKESTIGDIDNIVGRIEALQGEITYKQQAIDELKQIKN